MFSGHQGEQQRAANTALKDPNVYGDGLKKKKKTVLSGLHL